jgi:hypothetical protein
MARVGEVVETLTGSKPSASTVSCVFHTKDQRICAVEGEQAVRVLRGVTIAFGAKHTLRELQPRNMQNFAALCFFQEDLIRHKE